MLPNAFRCGEFHINSLTLAEVPLFNYTTAHRERESMPVQDRSCLLQDIWHIIDVVYTQRSKSDDFPVTSDGHSPTKDTGYPLEESLDGGGKRGSTGVKGGKKKKKI